MRGAPSILFASNLFLIVTGRRHKLIASLEILRAPPRGQLRDRSEADRGRGPVVPSDAAST